MASPTAFRGPSAPPKASLPLLALPVLLLSIILGCGGGGTDAGSATPTPSPAPTLAPGVTPGPGVSRRQIRLGMTNDIAGTGDTPYAAVTDAMRAYFNKVNIEDRGVCGREILLTAEDDQYTPELAVEKTRKLVDEGRTLAIIGSLGTQAHRLVAPYLNDPNGDGNTADGVPDLFLSTGWSGWRDMTKFPWTVTYIPDYATDAAILTQHINEDSPGKKVGILFQNDPAGQDYDATVKARLAEPALLVAEEMYDTTVTDFGPSITRLKEARVEILVLGSNPEDTAAAILAAESQDFKPQLLLSYVNSPSRLAADIGGGTNPDQLARGFQLLTGAVTTSYLLSPVDDDMHEAVLEHSRIMTEFDGPGVSTLTIYAQSLAETVVATLGQACAELTRKGLLEAAESLSRFHPSLFLPGIDVALGPRDHTSIQTLQLVRMTPEGTTENIGDPVTVE